VNKVGVTRNRVDLTANLLELLVLVLKILKLGWAYEGEVCRVEEEY
jgi:hypothetical protein